uniref:Uncharacterized protein n=1 Tax=Opuntia streptacantha TaxID=393608 RepID=A0A7C9D204_OPUST
MEELVLTPSCSLYCSPLIMALLCFLPYPSLSKMTSTMNFRMELEAKQKTHTHFQYSMWILLKQELRRNSLTNLFKCSIFKLLCFRTAFTEVIPVMCSFAYVMGLQCGARKTRYSLTE